MGDAPNLPTPDAPILSTLNEDGSRKWMEPRLSIGAFWKARRIVGYLLIAIFVALPFIKINGKPAMFLDISNREFSFFGHTFFATDTIVLALFLVTFIVGIFLTTAMFGRIWCGWACPQTVYLEFVYRPIERLFEGTRGKGGPARRKGGGRKLLKLVVYFVISFALAHVFLAYFVGIDDLSQWMRSSPFEHPSSFLIVAVTTGLMMFNFTYFREQTCIVACPYGRLQSVMLDRDSLIISYDKQRGEPRGKLRRPQKDADGTPLPVAHQGDCIDCKLCVTTCPTGIDIRNGLQLECVGCAQCIDACDDVMRRIDKPIGLIRYTSQAALEGARKRILRGRVFYYGGIIAILLGAFTFAVATKQTTDVRILRGMGRAYNMMPDGTVSTQLQVKITNRTTDEVCYTLAVHEGPEGMKLLANENPLCVESRDVRSESFVVVLPPTAYVDGYRTVTFGVTDGGDYSQEIEYKLIGPREAIQAASTATQAGSTN